MNYPRSAYVHIPFCHRRCFYCDFPLVPLGDKANGEVGPGSSSIKSYLKLLYREIALAPKSFPLSTIYIGGGTPSLLTPNQVNELLNHLRDHFGFQEGAEVTFEIDPASFNKQELQEFLDAGINRLSLGAQSFDEEMLINIGRRHDLKQLLDSCAWIKQAFLERDLFTWSLDFIKNLPGQNLKSWKMQLDQVLDVRPPHISIYDLSIEKGTVFSWRQKRGELNLPSDDLAADINLLTSATLKKEGYSRYEISNFALPGHISRHNRVYWSGAGWWGFGLGATSCPWGKRFSRPRNRAEYQAWIEGQELKGSHQSLKPSSRSIDLDELLLVGLRQREGIDFEELARTFGWEKSQRKLFLKQLENYWNASIEAGWIIRRGNRFSLSDPEGMDVSNHVFVEMLLWWDSLPKDAVDLPSF